MTDADLLAEIRWLISENDHFGMTDADAADTLNDIDRLVHGLRPDAEGSITAPREES